MIEGIIFGWRRDLQKTIAHVFCSTLGADLSLCGLAAQIKCKLPAGDIKCKACKKRLDKIMSNNSSWPSEWVPPKARENALAGKKRRLTPRRAKGAMTISVLDGPTLVDGAKEWLETSWSKWPSMTPDDMIKAMVQAKYIVKMKLPDNVYFGVQAVLLSFSRTGNAWPPVTPEEFAASLSDDEDQLVTLANCIIKAEATEPILQVLK